MEIVKIFLEKHAVLELKPTQLAINGKFVHQLPLQDVQLLPDRRRVETSRCLSHVVCVHIYIYVVCEPCHGEFTTSAAAQHTQLVTQYIQ